MKIYDRKNIIIFIITVLLILSFAWNWSQIYRYKKSTSCDDVICRTYKDFVEKYGEPKYEIITPVYFDSGELDRDEFFSTESAYLGYRRAEFEGSKNHYIFKTNGDLLGWFPDYPTNRFIYLIEKDLMKKFN